jgi:hypothetical protein
MEAHKMKNFHNLTILILSLAGIIASGPASAGSTLHIGPGYGTACATGGCPLYNNEVNAFGGTLDIYQNSGGAPDLTSFYLILGAANDTASGTALSGSSVGSGTLYPGASSVSVGSPTFQGLMTSGQEAYSVAGFSSPNSSNSFTNWSAWDAAILGITATNFGIYTYVIDTSTFGAHDTIDIALSNIPSGTFAIAFGTDSSGSLYGTPFTEAGLETHRKVPEPATLGLLGLGLLGIVVMQRRKVIAA